MDSSRSACSLVTLLLAITLAFPAGAQEHSVARAWNDALLDAIRVDFARPTVHARNLFHTSIALYDAWVVYSDGPEETFLLGQSVDGYTCGFDRIEPAADTKAAREEAMSYAAYRLLQHRFINSPGWETTSPRFDALFDSLGYDRNFVDRSNPGSSPARLGNHLANCLIEFGLQDGSYEASDYMGDSYHPVNPPLAPDLFNVPELVDPNRWQPLALEVFVDQGGNLLDSRSPSFLGPEWGRVVPFSLRAEDRRIYERDGTSWVVYHDPGPPPSIESDFYKWNFAVVAAWSSHLHPNDGVVIDISPASIGNLSVEELPRTPEEYVDFYDMQNGGDPSRGREMNPHTGQPYEPQIVPRGDYARVLAEFWADGPDSETPPGHWFTILNYVNDHPEFTRRFGGTGPVMDPLEWDVKAYLILGGAMHDAAVTAWGIKGWYDYIRPISALRYMASLGQSSDPADDLTYAPNGIPLIPGLIERVRDDDPLAILTDSNIGRIKFLAWRGPRAISNPATDEAEVDWILGQNWWPYQRPNFVTPPFAGYISGHSTFSRAAAEVMTLLTGDEYFPGGMGEFVAPQNEFLVFEDGPSVDVTLQWATYRDASDQTSLSRIWGGIHPPVDDIPGRLIGIRIGLDAFEHADRLFNGNAMTAVMEPEERREQDAATTTAGVAALSAWPNPVHRGSVLQVNLGTAVSGDVGLYNILGQRVLRAPGQQHLRIDTRALASGVYWLRVIGAPGGVRTTPGILVID